MAVQLPNPVTPVAVVAIPRLYPHVEDITDWRASQSLHLAWDRIHDLEERLQAAQASQAAIIAVVNALLPAIQAVEVIAAQAYAKTQQP